jgi:hypothetical protein
MVLHNLILSILAPTPQPTPMSLLLRLNYLGIIDPDAVLLILIDGFA